MSFELSVRSQEQATRTVINSFNEAFNRHDTDALSALLTDDTVFEDTSPAPDGRRIEGKAAVDDYWRGWFARNPDARFEAEEVIVNGSRAVVRWVYRKTRNGQPRCGHLHGARRKSSSEARLRERINVMAATASTPGPVCALLCGLP